MSRANFKRVSLDETEAERNEFWALCKKMEEDDELAKQMSQVSEPASEYRGKLTN